MNHQTSQTVTHINNDSECEDRIGQSMTRRNFLRMITTSAAAFAVVACGGGGGGATASAQQSSTSTPGSNHPPVWDTIPTITFTQGIAASFSIAAFVSDEDHNALTISKNSVALPPGVTYDPAIKSFVYDGIGAVAYTDGHVLTASEG